MNLNWLVEGLNVRPYQHQLDAVEFFHDKKDGNLFFEMGCLSGNTEITINRKGASVKMSLSEAYKKVPLMKTKEGLPAIVSTRAFIGDRIGLHKINNIVFSGKKETFKLVLMSGKTLELTSDHEVLTKRGFIPASSLTVEDEIMVDNFAKPKKIGKKRPVNYLYSRVANHPYGRKRSVIRKHSKNHYEEIYYIVPTHRLIAEKELNNGIPLDPEVYAVHHKDLNHRNNDPSNLLICTHAEHHKIHEELSVKNLYQGIVEYEKFKELIPIGIQDTYDIVCEDPHRNFVANGIVVHNCGKTGTAILTYRNWCKKEGRALRCLVVAPSVVLHNWKDEFGIFSFVDKEKIFPLTRGSGKEKAEIIYDKVIPVLDGLIVNVNYEALLSADLFKAIERWNPEVIIFDEVHKLKNPTSKRSKLCMRLAESAMYRLGLTGTPILRNSIDIFGIFKSVDLGKTFGTNLYLFQNKYLLDLNARNPHVSFPNWKDNPATFSELNSRIYAKSLRKLKSECLDLPELIPIIRNVEFGPKQKKAYDELKKEFLTFVDARTASGEPASVTANLAIVKALRMLQVTSGFVTTDDGTIHEFEDCPRLDTVEELLTEIVIEGKEKCILWCSYKHNYKMLSRVCTKLGIKHCFITGEESTNEKRESELAFQKDPETMVVIANRGAGGLGVNLTAAPYSIVYSRNFRLDEELQSESRNHRGGSEIHDKIVKIDLAIKGTVEELLILALRNKQQVSTEILDMVRG